MSGRNRSRLMLLGSSLSFSLALALGCGDRGRPTASEDTGLPGGWTGGGVRSPAAGSGGAGQGQGGAGGASVSGAGGAGSGGSPTTFPDCACLADRAANASGCGTCYDAAEISLGCAQAEEACGTDPNGCLVAVETAKGCPAGAGFASCVQTAFAFASATTIVLAIDLLDCACGACQAECQQGDACP